MKKLAIFGMVLLGLLFFIFPIPRTISLRDLLLLLVLLVFGYIAWRNRRRRDSLRRLIVPAMLLALLTAWMYGVAFFVSPETAWSLDEVASQWLRALVALAAGVAVALAVESDSDLKQKALSAVFIALLLHVLYVDLEAMNIWWHGQGLDRLAGLTEGPDKSNYLTNILFCFLLAESYIRIIHGKRLLPFGNGILLAVSALTVISEFVERTRNGIFTLVLLLVVLATLYLVERRKQLKKSVVVAGIVAMFILAVGGLGLVVAARQSSSLDNLIGTVAIAWDTEHYRTWQDSDPHEWPKLSSGQTVDPSAYQRVAWLKEGLLLFKEHPFGIGFGRNAFGHGLEAKYGKGGGHSHSGLVDLAIGTGVPGVLLWLGFLASLMRLAWKQARVAKGYAAVLLLLVLLDFGTRMVLDSMIRDHMLQQFMFLAGLAAVLTVAEVAKKRKAPA